MRYEQFLDIVNLGDLRFASDGLGVQPSDSVLAIPPFLSAGSGCTVSGGVAHIIGDDLNTLGIFRLTERQILRALRKRDLGSIVRPGVAQRIIAGNLPSDPGELASSKHDLEGLCIIRKRDYRGIGDARVRSLMARQFPHGLLFIAGSGGLSWTNYRRSTGVICALNRRGEIIGMPTDVPLNGLHEYLEQNHIKGRPNIEGVTVHGEYLVLAHRGNGLDNTGRPMPSMLIGLSLAEVCKSLLTDHKIDQCEIEWIEDYDLGTLPLVVGGQEHAVELDITDLDAVAGDPYGRLVFTAAAEASDPPEIRGKVAGSVVGVMTRNRKVVHQVPLGDHTIKLEGVDARYNWRRRQIRLLLTSDADDSTVPAPLMAAWL